MWLCFQLVSSKTNFAALSPPGCKLICIACCAVEGDTARGTAFTEKKTTLNYVTDGKKQ